MKVLITGATGFIGRYLVHYLGQGKNEIYALSRQSSIQARKIIACDRYFSIDINNSAALQKVVKLSKPDYIFHLAAQSLIPRSWSNPKQTILANAFPAVDLIAASASLKTKPTIIITGSSSQYGSQRGRYSEDYQLQPNNPYSISKVTQELLARIYSQRFGVKVLFTRPFAVIGPGKVGDFMYDVTTQIAQAEKRGKAKSGIACGNLNTKRDFIDVRDAVRVMALIARRGKSGSVYNICNGRATSLKTITGLLQKYTKVKLEFKPKENKIRVLDDPVIVGNNKRIVALGYKPKYLLKDTVLDTLNWSRE